MMTRRAALLALAAATKSRASEPNLLSVAERREGWRLLFDGKTTNGWLEVTGKPFPSDCWTVQDGALHALPRSGFQDIRTAGVFGAFDLRFEWKIGAEGNTGLKYLVQRVDEWTNAGGRQARARGLEYQLADDANDDAASDPRRAVASLYSALKPSPRVSPRIGEYNQSRILFDGRNVEHWFNGVRVLRYDVNSPVVQALLRSHLPKDSPDGPISFRTPISLQNHASPAWFRDLKIRPL
jgi:hypothetical protein